MYTRPKPFIVATYSSKANVAKTSWVVLMAWYFSTIRKFRVHTHDADPEHESLTRWLDTINDMPGRDKVPFTWKSAIGETLLNKIPETSADADIAFVDIGGGRNKLATAATGFADLFVVATGESVLESITIDDAFDAVTVGEARFKRTVTKGILLTKIPPGATRIVKTLQDEYLEEQEANNVPEAEMIGVFDHPFPVRKNYMKLGMRHPSESGVDIDLTNASDVKTIEIANMAAEIEEEMVKGENHA
jgi:cellulose biosynthesis protein BcsQ